MVPRFCGWHVVSCALILLWASLPLIAGARAAPASPSQFAPALPLTSPPFLATRFETLGLHGAGALNMQTAGRQMTEGQSILGSWLFWVLLILAVAAVAAGIYRWRVASIERRKRNLAVDVAERTLYIAGEAADLEALYQADEELERHVQLDQVLQALVDIAVDRLHADKSAVLAWDDRRERLAVRVARNYGESAIAELSFAPGEGYVGQVLATGEPVTVADAVTDLYRVHERAEVIEALLGEGIRSFMHIPIRLDGEVFGVFNVCYDEVRAFGEREQRLFTALAQRAALAVQNAQHFAREQRRAEQFRVISEVGRRITSILDVGQLLEEILDELNKAFGYQVMGIALIEGDELVMKVSNPRDWQEAGVAPLRLPVGEVGVMAWVAKTGQPMRVPDVSKEPHYVQWPPKAQTRSELAVPMLTKAGVIGVLNVESEKLDAFDESDLAVLQTLANQAAISVENARLYASINRQVARLTALQDTNRALASTLERDALLKLIIAQATTLLRADGGLINLVDWERREDEVVAGSGTGAKLLGARNSLDAGLSGWVTLHNRPIVSNCLSEDNRIARSSRLWMEQDHIESAALAPLTVKDEVVGTLALIKEQGKGGFDQEDLDLLVAFADQAAIAIENARLYEEAQQLAASQERGRLARDLHDAVTQTLFSASLIAEVLPALWESDQAAGRQLLRELRQLTRGALAEMRTLLLELRPAALIESNLGDLLRQLAESVSGRTGIPVTVSLEGCPMPDLPDDVHVALYRIAQEALNNVVKHAQAKQAGVRLACSRDLDRAEEPVRVRLSISDDGQGFDPAAVPLDHLGLGIIRERAQAIGATLHIDSRAGRGTVVEAFWTSGRP